MISKLLLSVYRGVWAIDERAISAGLQMVEAAVSRGKVENYDTQVEDKSAKYNFQMAVVNQGFKSSFKSFSNTDNIPAGSVAIIPIQDVIMTEDYCGSPGTNTMQRWLDSANAHPNIVGIVLQINSPGGSADAMFEMAAAVKQSVKPVVTSASWLMASAAYGIGSCATEILLQQDNLSEVGSIGTMIRWADYQKAYEAQGVKFHEVYATKSTDKNKIFSQANAGNYKPLIENVLNPFNEEFLAMVQVNRAGKIDLKKENVLSGKTYLTQNAIAFGLADGVGTLDNAVTRVIELANKK